MILTTQHVRAASGAEGIKLQAMVQSSNSYQEFLQKLNLWTDREFNPSHSARWPQDAPLWRYSRPDNLQVRSR
jgi:hypothetical protein